MNFLYAIFFGAGVSALAYNTLVRRVGYSNSQNVWILVGAIFVMSTIVFFTVLALFIHK